MINRVGLIRHRWR